MKISANTPLIRRLNEAAVLDYIRDHGPVSRTDVSRALQLSPPTITRIVNQLMVEGSIFEAEAGNSTGGRPPILLEFNRHNSLILGLIIGTTQVVGALADLEGEILARRTVAVPDDSTPVAVFLNLIQELLDIPRPPGQAMRGIGVGVPSTPMTSSDLSPSAPGLNWSALPLKDLIVGRFHIPTFLARNVNLAALGEYWRGAGQGISNQVVMALGDRIGAGLILNGELFTGGRGAAGEIGYILTDRVHLFRPVTDRGALESEAAIPAIIRRFQDSAGADPAFKVTGLVDRELYPLSLQHVFDAALQDDPAATAVLHATADYLAMAIANLACILNPDLVILGGDLTPHAAMLIPLIEARIEGTVPVVPRLVPSTLGHDAPVLGALALVLRSTGRLIDL
ncbi:MAG: ROK family transcriptional regulator [Chloroflexi bacterium]|nr:ROK family transcriptional regulator [Chloroflexota bacterium]